MSINLRIKELREIKKLQKNEFSSILKVDSSQYSKIEAGKLQPTINLIMEISSIFNVDSNWLLTGKGEKFLDQKSSSTIPAEKKVKIIPLIPTEAIAGNGNGSVSILEGDVMSQYVVPDFVNADFMIRVKGSSMYPKYNSGDVIACKRIHEQGLIQWGKVFLMHHKEQGAIVKRLFPSEKDDSLKCVSDNVKYPPFDILKKEIDSIALVVGVIRLE